MNYKIRIIDGEPLPECLRDRVYTSINEAANKISCFVHLFDGIKQVDGAVYELDADGQNEDVEFFSSLFDGNKRKIIEVYNGMKMEVEFGHTVKEWERLIDGDDNFWHFDFEEFLNGAIEPLERMTYWYIDGRVYETNF